MIGTGGAVSGSTSRFFYVLRTKKSPRMAG
jgi:hypothetical protein